MKAEQNELITRIGPGTPCGNLMRRYWQPVALVDEFNPALDPAMGVRPVKAVRLLGQDFVLFKNADGSFGLLDRDCPHRGANPAFGRNEGDGLRCPFHGWKFDAAGRCTDTPASPPAARCASASNSAATRVAGKAGVLFGWFGPEDVSPPPFPVRLFCRAGHAQLCLQGPVGLQLAAGVRSGHRPGACVLLAPLFLRRVAGGKLRPPVPCVPAWASSMASACP